MRIARGPLTKAAVMPRIVASGDSVCAIWRDARNGQPDIYGVRSVDGGRTFGANVRINTDPPGAAFADQPRLATDGTTVYAVWTDSRDGRTDIRSNRSLDYGATWLGSDVRLDTDVAGSANSEVPNLAAAGGEVVVVWQDSRSGAPDVHCNLSTDGGATYLGRDLRLDTDRAGATTSSLPVVTRFGPLVYAAWVEYSSGQPNVVFSRSSDGGRSWLPWVRPLERDPAAALAPTIASRGAGVYVAWNDRRFGGTDVFATVPFGWLTYGPGKPGSGGASPFLLSFQPATIGSRPVLILGQGLGGFVRRAAGRLRPQVTGRPAVRRRDARSRPGADAADPTWRRTRPARCRVGDVSNLAAAQSVACSARTSTSSRCSTTRAPRSSSR